MLLYIMFQEMSRPQISLFYVRSFDQSVNFLKKLVGENDGDNYIKYRNIKSYAILYKEINNLLLG